MREVTMILALIALLGAVITGVLGFLYYPAKAKREAMELEARGQAASIIEDGEAQVRVLKAMIETYKSADGDGEKVFMLNMLPEIIEELAKTVDKVVTAVEASPAGKTDWCFPWGR